jgi:ribosomal-protein-alanine N-acetyltransferase
LAEEISDVRIVPMTREDLPQVLEIERVSFPLPFSENLFHMELDLNSAHMMVAKLGDEVRGYLDFWHIDNEMHVINIAVSPRSRREGIGSQLMRYLAEFGNRKQAELIYLDVRESNVAAINLYKKCGFEQIDIRKGYYQDNEEDALVMELKLKSE